MPTGGVRPAAKSGPIDESWYSDNPQELREQLGGFLNLVPSSIDGASLPIPGARVIISPHAGFKYSGKCAAWAFKCLDLSQVKRVFILGPAHAYYLEGCAVTTYDEWATPFGNLTVDRETSNAIKAKGEMEDMPREGDKGEHSMEMEVPYLYLRCQEMFKTPDRFPKIVPILVGDTNRAKEKAIGRQLIPYLKDPQNAFIVSSDFCHWGHYFNYLVYSAKGDISNFQKLSRFDPAPKGPPIHETIKLIDEAAMTAVESGSHDAFQDNLKLTRNTVCGRHPIGVMMAALEQLGKEQPAANKYRFKFVQYQRSNLVTSPSTSSVSYCAAYSIL